VPISRRNFIRASTGRLRVQASRSAKVPEFTAFIHEGQETRMIKALNAPRSEPW